jgi:DNA mismatch endonuclease (patch repair protein)
VDTGPEVAVRRAIHAQGLRYRKNLVVPLAGRSVRPDIVFTRARLAVFVDGCFWHGCPDHASSPKANQAFWAEKLRRNRARDLADRTALEAAGWKVLRVWEHEDPRDAVARIQTVFAAAQPPSPPPASPDPARSRKT